MANVDDHIEEGARDCELSQELGRLEKLRAQNPTNLGKLIAACCSFGTG
jgi:hypothetical protein